MKILVLYDMRNSKKRRKVQKRVSENSFFYQKSAYEIDVKLCNLKEVKKFLEEVCEEGDRVHIFRCFDVIYLGKKPIKELIVWKRWVLLLHMI